VAHGSVLRCQRMFIRVKHSVNEGGAVAARDAAGVKERQNIAVLQRKWPGVFSINTKRKAAANSEVVMCWRRYAKFSQRNDSAMAQGKKLKREQLPPMAEKRIYVQDLAGLETRKLKRLKSLGISSSTFVRYTGKRSKMDYVNKRCEVVKRKMRITKLLVLRVPSSYGRLRFYPVDDLKRDIQSGRIEVLK